MARAQWPLVRDRPVIEVVLTLVQGGQKLTRSLLADTGAGNAQAMFEFLLDEKDCLLCGTSASEMISLGGAYVGFYPVYLIQLELPLLAVAGDFRAVGIPHPPKGLDGIAGFRFLNRFTSGNFGSPLAFGLET